MTKTEIAKKLEYFESKIEQLSQIPVTTEAEGVVIDLDFDNGKPTQILLGWEEWPDLRIDILKALNKSCERMRREMHDALYPTL